MKISLLEPLGIPDAVLRAHADKLTAAGHTFVSFDDKTADPAELLRRIGDSEIAVIANNPMPAAVLAQAPALRMPARSGPAGCSSTSSAATLTATACGASAR